MNFRGDTVIGGEHLWQAPGVRRGSPAGGRPSLGRARSPFALWLAPPPQPGFIPLHMCQA